MTETNVRMNDTYIDSLSRSISHAKAADNVPALIKKVIGSQMWRYRIVKQTKQAASFDTFRQFVEAPQPEGLNTTVDRLIALCRFTGDDDAAQVVARAGEVALRENAERRRDLAVIDNLSAALLESLTWSYIEHAQPPYRVPCAIQGDLWRWQTTSDKGEAYDIIKRAVDYAASRGA